MKTIKQLARELYDEFERDDSNKEKPRYFPPYGKKRSADLKKVINAVYEQQNEVAFNEIHTALGVFSDAVDTVDAQVYVDEVEPDIYNSDLLEWMLEARHIDDVDEAIKNGSETVIDAIQIAQGSWRQSIYQTVLDTLKEIVAESVEEEAEVVGVVLVKDEEQIGDVYALDTDNSTIEKLED